MFGGDLQVRDGSKVSPYLFSRLVQKTKDHRFWSIYDLDGTYAAGSLEARRKVREWSEKRGALLFSTARTPELVMTPESFELSRKFAGFERPMYWWAYDTGPLQHDPDAILSFGQGVYLAGTELGQQGCAPYYVDREYEDLHLDPAVDGKLIASAPWKTLVRRLIHRLNLSGNLTNIDHPNAHKTMVANVWEPKFRATLEFRGAGAIARKSEALELIQKQSVGGPLAGRIDGVDESKPSDNPTLNLGRLHVVPPGARKPDMLNHPLVQSCTHARVQTAHVKGIAAGDQITDFDLLCHGALDAGITGILVGGSPVGKAIKEKTNFAAVDLGGYRACFKPTARKGFYHYINPQTRGGWENPNNPRLIVVGDEAYPDTIGVETIWAYIEEHQHALAA